MMTKLWRFLCGNKKYWLVPLALLLLVMAFLAYINSGPEPSPMVYTFF